jgi:hypothetical protein
MSHVAVNITYKGKPFTSEMSKQHPELMSLFPDMSTFLALYLPLRDKAIKSGILQFLDISEDGIMINGVPITLT